MITNATPLDETGLVYTHSENYTIYNKTFSAPFDMEVRIYITGDAILSVNGKIDELYIADGVSLDDAIDEAWTATEDWALDLFEAWSNEYNKENK